MASRVSSTRAGAEGPVRQAGSPTRMAMARAAAADCTGKGCIIEGPVLYIEGCPLCITPSPGSHGRFTVQEEGRLLGELTYSRAGAALVILDHTVVSPHARGTGAGRALVDAAVAWALQTGTKLMPLCPYARSVFEKECVARGRLAQVGPGALRDRPAVFCGRASLGV